MTISRDEVMAVLDQIAVEGGGTLASRDLVRALSVEGGAVRFVIEVPDAAAATAMQPAEAEARARLEALAGVSQVSIVTTAPTVRESGRGAAPDLKIGRHPTPQTGPEPVPGVGRILVVGSGKGGVGKSTLTANLAVALARQGRRVGLLDADIYGPSQPRMMGVSGRPEAPDGKTMQPLVGHGVKVMSLGLLVPDGQAIVWRGPMLMGAMQQMLGQVAWAPLDVLLIDLPPGTGDVQLTLCQKTRLDGAIIVSTPQDVALIDARRAVDMFRRLGTPILGLVENMASYCCPNCNHVTHPFGHGGVRDEAARMGSPFLGEIPLDLDVRMSGDRGVPVAAGEGPIADAYAHLARGLITSGAA
ncbi:MRP family ATP-binding protein [Paracoccus suum]|uniref:Iron-sulfur cluster carrier protein n=1 Tax=Paracoccus suum TaxID=2259340 RepID=A0A344PJH0_9RHOB|nr:Mrp/NBP35 family ATP-binding protein [Paracoccus suum]AXC49525.1 MRP family ATP-binding protein [Paracoccus suum]